MAVLHIPQDFSRRLDSGNKASLQVLLDGRRSNAAQIVNGYLGDLFNTYGLELLAKQTSPKQANPPLCFQPANARPNWCSPAGAD